MAFGWALEITYCDVENNRFLTLGGAQWKTKRDRDRNLATIPASGVDHNLILDICSPRGIEDDRLISPATVEALTRRPIEELITEAAMRFAEAPAEGRE